MLSIFTEFILFLSLSNILPHIFFPILRIIIVLSSLFHAILAYGNDKKIYMVLFIVIAIVFNPFITPRIPKDIWIFIHIASIFIFLNYEKKREKIIKRRMYIEELLHNAIKDRHLISITTKQYGCCKIIPYELILSNLRCDILEDEKVHRNKYIYIYDIKKASLIKSDK
jgi:hypothetical protein